MSTQIGIAQGMDDLIERVAAFVTSTGHAFGKTYTGTGNGDIRNYLGTATSVAEVFTITATSPTTFSVTGTTSGLQASATVGTPYAGDKLSFEITQGTTPFVVGDTFTLKTTPKWELLTKYGLTDTRKIVTNMTGKDGLIYIDNSAIGFFNGGTAASEATVDYEFIVPSPVKKVYLRSANSWQGVNGQTTIHPTQLTLSWRDNPLAAWTAVETKSFSLTTNEAIELLFSADSGSHKYWRVGMKTSNSSQNYAFAVEALALYPTAASSSRLDLGANYYFRAPGLDGNQSIYTMIRCFGLEGSNNYHLQLSGSRAIDISKTISQQTGVFDSGAFLLGVNTPINYWLTVNGQRLILVTKSNTIYQIAYLGFGYPYEPPSVHPYPLIIGGSMNTATQISTTSEKFRFLVNPGLNGVLAYYPNNNWYHHSNYRDDNNPNSAPVDNNGEGRVWPGQKFRFYGSFTTNQDGGRTLLPCILYNINPAHVWGEFDGVYWANGFNVTSETIIRSAGFDHLVVQSAFRTGPTDFGAVRLD